MFRRRCLIFLVPAALALLAAGCVTSEKFTLNEVSLKGPVARPPINVTIDPEPGAFQVIAGFATSNPPLVRGSIDPTGNSDNTTVYNPVSPSPRGNLTWEVPGNEYSLDLQLIAAQHFALTGGGTYASVGGYQFTNFRAGLGLFTMGDQYGVRVDAGVQFNSLRFRSRTTVSTVYEGPFSGNQTRYVTNFDDSGTEQSVGTAFGLTVNSAFTGSVFNGFVHIGLAYEPLFDYTPTSYDTVAGPGDSHAAFGNVKSTSAVLTFGGGAIIELGRGTRALLGVRGAQLLDVNSPAPRPLWQPFLEFVFTF